MARMLELLDVTGADRVLEIGTSTGYNAALLCHRLTDARVTSIDIDLTLIAEARDRLASLGYQPCLVAGDGAAGVPGGPRTTGSSPHVPCPRCLRTGSPSLPRTG
jgi:protein-L-isoaspartate O-methyltransferase